VPDVLRQHGYKVEIHDDHFAQTEKDVIWLRFVGQRKWIVLSKDPHIRKRALERKQLRRARVHAFFLGRADLKGAEMAEIFRRAIPKIIEMVTNAGNPVIALIRRDAILDVLDSNLKVAGVRKGTERREAGKKTDFSLRGSRCNRFQ
jgi:hypothetical protein